MYVSYYNPEEKLDFSKELIFTDSFLSLHPKFALTPNLISTEIMLANKKKSQASFSIEADRLVGQNEFQTYIKTITQYYELGLRHFRIKDVGVLNYLLTSSDFQDIKIILNVESAHHNVNSLLFYEKKYEKKICRFLVDPEITLDGLIIMREKLKTPFELRVLGPALLFYTPRKLISAQLQEKKKEIAENLTFTVNSLESSHSGMQAVETSHCTLLYSNFHLCYLDMLEDLKKAGVESYLINDFDLKESERSYLNQNINSFDYKNFKSFYSHRLIKGLFKVNKTKVLFGKLKNTNHIALDDYCAEVVEVKKNKYIVFMQKSDPLIHIGSRLYLKSPDGREKNHIVQSLFDGDGSPIESTYIGGCFRLKAVAGMSVQAKIRVISNT